jgi:hypothetical protein
MRGVISRLPATATLRSLLIELSESGRTGALHVGGHPGGVFYLIAGRITHAESPACPGIGERLVASGRVPARAWQAAYADGRGTHRVGRLLQRDGVIGQTELALRVVATIGDATHEILRTGAGAPVRFVPGERHWLGEIAHLEPGALGHVTAQRLRTVPGPRRRRQRASTVL